jgi:hypothetical protein
MSKSQLQSNKLEGILKKNLQRMSKLMNQEKSRSHLKNQQQEKLMMNLHKKNNQQSQRKKSSLKQLKSQPKNQNQR